MGFFGATLSHYTTNVSFLLNFFFQVFVVWEGLSLDSVSAGRLCLSARVHHRHLRRRPPWRVLSLPDRDHRLRVGSPLRRLLARRGCCCWRCYCYYYCYCCSSSFCGSAARRASCRRWARTGRRASAASGISCTQNTWRGKRRRLMVDGSRSVRLLRQVRRPARLRQRASQARWPGFPVRTPNTLRNCQITCTGRRNSKKKTDFERKVL